MTVISVEQPDQALAEFVRGALYAREPVTLTAHGEAKAVLLSIEDYKILVSASKWLRKPILSWPKLQAEIQQSLHTSGYTTREAVLQLVRDAKRDAADQSHQSHQ